MRMRASTTRGSSSPRRWRHAKRARDIRTRTRFEGAVRDGGVWRATLVDDRRERASEVRAKAIVNAAGPWVARVLDTIGAAPASARVRHVKGSHIVVPEDPRRGPRLHPAERGQSHRLRHSLPGTLFADRHDRRAGRTPTSDPRSRRDEETDYLIELVNRYLERPLARDDVVWTYSGVRPLYDDGESDPAAVTRDYVLKVDAGADGAAAAGAVRVRRQADDVSQARRGGAERSATATSPGCRGAWTARDVLPGGDLAGRRSQGLRRRARARAIQRFRQRCVADLVKRHGTRATAVLGDAKSPPISAATFADNLTEREVDYMLPARMGAQRRRHPVAAHEVRPRRDGGAARRAGRAPGRMTSMSTRATPDPHRERLPVLRRERRDARGLCARGTRARRAARARARGARLRRRQRRPDERGGERGARAKAAR